MTTKATTSKTVEVGQVRLIPFPVNKNHIRFNCVILDTRQSYGRVEFKVAPVDGANDTVWLTEDTILSFGRGA